MNIPIAELKSNLSSLVKRVEAGEEVSVTRHGKVVARLVPAASDKPRQSLLGLWKDKEVWMSEDFDDPLPDFEDYM